ncbi:MAG: hypothetical protein C4586_06825 [Anaerolineaceae bacterium]|nr:MAG: hypothetical protein C4586_06825 [Anaerolineaceae bacterium]
MHLSILAATNSHNSLVEMYQYRLSFHNLRDVNWKLDGWIFNPTSREEKAQEDQDNSRIHGMMMRLSLPQQRPRTILQPLGQMRGFVFPLFIEIRALHSNIKGVINSFGKHLIKSYQWKVENSGLQSVADRIVR